MSLRTVEEVVEWLSNSNPSLAVHRVLALGILAGLDKCHTVHPIGAGDMLRRFLNKSYLSFTRLEASRSRGIDQFCGYLKASIEGVVIYVRLLLDM